MLALPSSGDAAALAHTDLPALQSFAPLASSELSLLPFAGPLLLRFPRPFPLSAQQLKTLCCTCTAQWLQWAFCALRKTLPAGTHPKQHQIEHCGARVAQSKPRNRESRVGLRDPCRRDPVGVGLPCELPSPSTSSSSTRLSTLKCPKKDGISDSFTFPLPLTCQASSSLPHPLFLCPQFLPAPPAIASGAAPPNSGWQRSRREVRLKGSSCNARCGFAHT